MDLGSKSWFETLFRLGTMKFESRNQVFHPKTMKNQLFWHLFGGSIKNIYTDQQTEWLLARRNSACHTSKEAGHQMLFSDSNPGRNHWIYSKITVYIDNAEVLGALLPSHFGQTDTRWLSTLPDTLIYDIVLQCFSSQITTPSRWSHVNFAFFGPGAWNRLAWGASAYHR